ncbi:MAG: tRNA pseudouridine(55) synthase TruB [Pseudomonadota bacterium]
MGRRKKGRDISGWLVVDKPAGLSSNDVVGKVRWAFDAKKAGHAGTLDPAATGVLAVALGEATKTVPYVTDALKAYDFTVTLGTATNTDDAEGEVIARSDLRPSRDTVEATLPQFTGDILQVPPKFSAIKVDGQRAYALARDGANVALAARPLYVDALELVEMADAGTLKLHMVCGKGGYVRAIARDLGERLGCLGHVTTLRRVWSGPFSVNGSVTVEQIEALAKTPEIDALLLPLEVGLEDLPEVRCGAEAALRLAHGNPAPVLSSDADFGEEAWASVGGQAVAIGTYRAGMIHPSRVLIRGEPGA